MPEIGTFSQISARQQARHAMKIASLLFRSRPLGTAARALVVGMTTYSLTGCGNTVYLVEVRRAEQHFREAKELGAEEHAPYEYYSAKARIEEAHVQAAHAEYGPASHLSHEANQFAIQAIDAAKKARSGQERKQ